MAGVYFEEYLSEDLAPAEVDVLGQNTPARGQRAQRRPAVARVLVPLDQAHDLQFRAVPSRRRSRHTQVAHHVRRTLRTSHDQQQHQPVLSERQVERLLVHRLEGYADQHPAGCQGSIERLVQCCVYRFAHARILHHYCRVSHRTYPETRNRYAWR